MTGPRRRGRASLVEQNQQLSPVLRRVLIVDRFARLIIFRLIASLQSFSLIMEEALISVQLLSNQWGPPLVSYFLSPFSIASIISSILFSGV